jgi:hypothetical protein
METTTKTTRETTLREFLAIVMADIDIFLLKEEDQETDKDKLYTKEEIRSQLQASLQKATSIFPMIGWQKFDVPLFSALGEKVLERDGFSRKQIEKYKELEENNN